MRMKNRKRILSAVLVAIFVQGIKAGIDGIITALRWIVGIGFRVEKWLSQKNRKSLDQICLGTNSSHIFKYNPQGLRLPKWLIFWFVLLEIYFIIAILCLAMTSCPVPDFSKSFLSVTFSFFRSLHISFFSLCIPSFFQLNYIKF